MNASLASKGYEMLAGIGGTAQQLASYNDCPHDPFMGNGTRYKRFSQYKLSFASSAWAAELLPPRAYVAKKKFNAVAGGFRRPYEPLQADFTRLILDLAARIGLDTACPWQINVHQNRSIANAEKDGQLTPEGRHQDGHEFVSISVLAREGVRGGCTRLWSSKDAPEPLLSHIMMPGETVLLDDRALWHDVTDIERDGRDIGYRDILIVAYSRWAEKWYGDEHDTAALGGGA